MTIVAVNMAGMCIIDESLFCYPFGVKLYWYSMVWASTCKVCKVTDKVRVRVSVNILM